MGTLDSIYRRLPGFAQTAATSLYGLRREWLRYSGDYNRHMRFLLDSQWQSDDWFRQYQIDQLKMLVQTARSHSRHYAATLHELNPDRISDLSVLESIPTLTKDVLRTTPESVLTEPGAKAVELHTSGSTGTPLTYRISVGDFRMRMALLERQRIWAGVNRHCRTATFTGRKIVPPESDREFWRRNLAAPHILYSAYHLSDCNQDAYLSSLAQFRPEVIEGYPSSLAVLAGWLLRTSKPYKISPRAIFTTAETLTGSQRSLIEQAFGCPVFDYYGSNDGAPMITQCEKGKKHLNPESGIVEFLRNDGSHANPGELAELVVTSFTSSLMPLIRYRIGDMAVYTDKTCDCGRRMPVIKEIVGRVDDVFHTPYRGHVGRLSTTLKLLPQQVREAQIRQTGPETFELVVALDRPHPEVSAFESALSDMRDKLGPVGIQLRVVDSIPRGANGKLRTQIKTF